MSSQNITCKICYDQFSIIILWEGNEVAENSFREIVRANKYETETKTYYQMPIKINCHA